jgi:hypothetical protein
VGYLAPGARADLIILNAPSHAHLAYRPGVPLVYAVYQSGCRQPSLPQWRGPNAPDRSCGAGSGCLSPRPDHQIFRNFTIRAFSVGGMIPKTLFRA